MSCLPTVGKQAPLLDYWRWNSQAPDLAKQYAVNKPVPHVFLRDFLDAECASALAEEFPRPSASVWTQYKHGNENKLGLNRRELFPPSLGDVTDELNSPRFLAWLTRLTGIPDLIADSALDGGGLHLSGRGGFLNLHTDFSHHHYHKNWKRRVNIILYLNPGWREEWGGALEFWPHSMERCLAKYPPFLNHALIFNTDGQSFHGFPEATNCPAGESRKSLAMYYYTLDEEAKPSHHSTNYRARPDDGIAKSALIWLDKQAVDLYSRAKTQFGFSDNLASRVLGMLSRKNEPGPDDKG